MTREQLEAVCWRELGAVAAVGMRYPGAVKREWLTEAIDRILSAADVFALGDRTPTEAVLQAGRRGVLFTESGGDPRNRHGGPKWKPMPDA